MIKNAVFIGGCDRSGTTMLAELIGRSDQTIVTPESQFKSEVLAGEPVGSIDSLNVSRVFSKIKSHWRYKLWGIDRDPDLTKIGSYQELIFSVVEHYRKSKEIRTDVSAALTWIDHTPRNIDHFKFLSTEFPESKFIHIVRDGRGVFSSFKGLPWGPQTAFFASRFWVNRAAVGLAMESSLGDRVMRVRYEDLLVEPEGSLRAIYEFLAIPVPENLMSREESKFLPGYTQKQHALVGKNPDASKVKSWRKKVDSEEISIFEMEAGCLLQLFGYELDTPLPYHPNLKMTQKIGFLVQEAFKRVRNRIKFEFRKRGN